MRSTFLTSNRRSLLFAALLALVLLVAGIMLAASTSAQTTAPLFGPNLPANVEKRDQQQEPSLAVNPKDPNSVLVAAKDWRSGEKEVWYYRSTDGGATWSDGHLAPLPGDLPNQSDPVVTFDAAGRAYLCIIGYNQEDLSKGGLYVARSDDGGVTWGAAVQVAANKEGLFNDKEWLAVDRSGAATDGYLYVSWTRFTAVDNRDDRGDIVVSRSTDGGATWGAPVVISQTPDESDVQGSFPAIGPHGELYVIYYSDFHGQHIKIARSTDGGASFTPATTVADAARPPSPLPTSRFRIFILPFLAVNPLTGALAVTWNDYAAGNSDVLLATSHDGGASFAKPLRVNRDDGANDQFMPAVGYGPDGIMHLAWLDRRADSRNLTYAAYYTQSADDGATLEQEVRLSDAESDPSVGFEGTLIGDYISVDAAVGKSYVAWVDTRNLTQDIYTVAITGTLPLTAPPISTPLATPTPPTGLVHSPQFVDPSFQHAWEHADLPVIDGKAQRTWLWGPQPFAAGYEAYQQGANGQRLVQYFDKARMELNTPAGAVTTTHVTNGLLVVELMSGRVQIGDNEFDAEGYKPSARAVAGDQNSPDAPSFAAMAHVASLHGDNRAADSSGQILTAGLDNQGQLTANAAPAGLSTAPKNAHYDTVLGHNIPDVFWDFLNRQGAVYENGDFKQGVVIDWLNDFGYPISEAYWIKIRVAGQDRSALVQAFQRRVLTYVPANDPQWQVEMGNVGRTYYEWRYGPGSPVEEEAGEFDDK